VEITRLVSWRKIPCPPVVFERTKHDKDNPKDERKISEANETKRVHIAESSCGGPPLFRGRGPAKANTETR
jgi:hypothetical protein